MKEPAARAESSAGSETGATPPTGGRSPCKTANQENDRLFSRLFLT